MLCTLAVLAVGLIFELFEVAVNGDDALLLSLALLVSERVALLVPEPVGCFVGWPALLVVELADAGDVW